MRLQVAPVNQLTNSVRSNVKLSGDLGKTKNTLHTGIVAPGRKKNCLDDRTIISYDPLSALAGAFTTTRTT